VIIPVIGGAAGGVIRQWRAKRGVTAPTDPTPSCDVIVNPQPSTPHCRFHPSILREGDVCVCVWVWGGGDKYAAFIFLHIKVLPSGLFFLSKWRGIAERELFVDVDITAEAAAHQLPRNVPVTGSLDQSQSRGPGRRPLFVFLKV